MSGSFNAIKDYKNKGQYGQALNLLNLSMRQDKSSGHAAAVCRDYFFRRFISQSALFIQFKMKADEALYDYLLKNMGKLSEDIYIRVINRSILYLDVLAIAPVEKNEASINEILVNLSSFLINYRLLNVGRADSRKPDPLLCKAAAELVENGKCETRDFKIILTENSREMLEKTLYEGKIPDIKRPELSVIIPVYNNEPYLEECLDSVIYHPFKDMEIIVVDDGSTDNSRDIIKKYIEKDARIKLHIQENSGAACARNRAMELSRGRYIAFLDSDDFWFQNDTLKKMIDYADRNDLYIVGAGLENYKNGFLEESRDEKMNLGSEGIYEYSDFQFDYTYWRFIYNADFLKKNNLTFPNYRRFQDPPFFVSAMIAAEKYGVVAGDFYAWRVAYKPLQMEYGQVCDFVRGLTDNLVSSSHARLARLHDLCVARINFRTYANAIRRFIKDGYLRSLLHRFNSAIDIQLLKENGYDYEEGYKISLLAE